MGEIRDDGNVELVPGKQNDERVHLVDRACWAVCETCFRKASRKTDLRVDSVNTVSATATKLKEPSILLASSNCWRMLKNVGHVLDASAIGALEAEIGRNVRALFKLGEGHLDFAKSINASWWRQKVSRLYYGAYNVRRAVLLFHEGQFATDSSDHKNVGDLPKDFPDANTFGARLQTLRDDRNLADYNHLAEVTDLMDRPADMEAFVVEFRNVAYAYLTKRGLVI